MLLRDFSEKIEEENEEKILEKKREEQTPLFHVKETKRIKIQNDNSVPSLHIYLIADADDDDACLLFLPISSSSFF